MIFRFFFFSLVVFGAVSRASDTANILLIVSEDNGPELGCYGDPYARTPNLDQLASQGVLFKNAFVPYSVCSPSRACFLTGLYPHQNGQIGLATHKFAMYSKDTPNFATLFKEAGYRTGLIGKLHVNPESAFPFDFRAIKGANFGRKNPVTDYADHAKEFWNEQAKGHPWFLSVNYPDAHLPFLKKVNGRPDKPLNADDVKPMPWVGVDTPRLRNEVANYYNCMERLDTGVGLLLDALEESGESENTVVIYIGDHGAQFPRGKGTVYEGGLRVPMLIRWPGVARAGLVREELVSTVDLLPTALAAANPGETRRELNLPGYDLRPLLGGGKPETWRQYEYGFTTGSFPRAVFVQHSIRDARYKLISSPLPGTTNHDARTYLDETHPHFVVSGATSKDQEMASPQTKAAWERWEKPPRYELYDLESDPSEWKNLADDPKFSEIKTRLTNALTEWQTRSADPFIDPVRVERFVEHQLDFRDLRYKSIKDFRWPYLDEFPGVRESMKK